MEIAVITSGYFPVPDSQGGAVEHLVTLLLKGAERATADINLHVLSCWDREAEEASRSFPKTSFEFIRTGAAFRLVDHAIYGGARYILRKEKSFSYRYIFQRLSYLGKVAKNLGEHQYDAVLVENHPILLLPFKNKVLMGRYKGKVFLHLHNELSGYYGCERQLRSVAHVIGISEFICQSFVRALPGFNADKCSVLRNRVEVDRYGTPEANKRSLAIRAKYGIHTDEKVIFFSGRLSPEKGVRELLAAFGGVVKAVPNVRMVIAGASYYTSGTTSIFEDELIQAARRYGDAVIFTSYVNHEEIPAYYAMADVCAAPSTWEEPACMSAIEAIAAGKPLVATKSGGMSEYLDVSYSVLLDRGPGLSVSLEKALVTLLSDDVMRAEMAQAALEARSKFSSETYFKDFAAIVEDSLRDASGAEIEGE